MRPVDVVNPSLTPKRREIGWYGKSDEARGTGRGQFKVGIPRELADAVGVTSKDAFNISVWEREDGRRVLVLEPEVR